MDIGLYEILLYLHVLCFVYWLGGDLGVFYGSGQLLKTGYSKEARQAIIKIYHWLDQFPRLCMPLVIALGFTMGSMRWFPNELAPLWLILIWAITFMWIYFVLALFNGWGGATGLAVVRKADMAMRWVIAIAITVIAIMSFTGQGITEDKWLAAKLLIWAGTVFCGIVSRKFMAPFRPAHARVMEHGENPEDLAIMKQALWTTRIPILSIWGLVFLAGAIGLWKPF